jgi:transcriptional regulator with XRE-family HTH domain
MQRGTVKLLLERLKQLRVHRGLTQEAFAEEAQISYKYYQAVEAGRKIDLRLSTLERLAKAHGKEVWELLLPPSQDSALAEPTPKQAKTPRLRRTRKKPSTG